MIDMVYRVTLEARQGKKIINWRTSTIDERGEIRLMIMFDKDDPLISVEAIFDSNRCIEIHAFSGAESIMRFYMAFPNEAHDQTFDVPLTQRKRLRISIVRQSVARSEWLPA